ncbi:MAG: DUF4013 domain-containing protein [Chloroflexi bacterium]|nr:DUF4013 domain-containing protein [Chloroflexota bacterium]
MVNQNLVGGILTIIPIVNFVVIGYVLQLLKNVRDGVERPMPNWDNFGDYFMKGLMVVIAVIIYAIPIILLSCVSGAFSAALGGRGQEGVRGLAALFTSAVGCLSSLWGLLLAVVLPAAVVKYAEADELSAFFRFGDIFSFITKDLGTYIIVIILSYLAHFVAGFGVILCFVGVIFTAFWASLVQGHLLGQLARQHKMV